MAGHRIVLDVGKTLAKLSLWTADGRLIAKRRRPNRKIETADYTALDVHGISLWLEEVLAEFARFGGIEAVIPVGHGAAAAVVRDGALAALPMDYEFAIPTGRRERYRASRDAFADTGSPALSQGQNLAAQLDFLEALYPDLLDNSVILPWPQYWAWYLSGVFASEVTSLGCHTDLWSPAKGRPSTLAWKRGWAAHLAPLCNAGSIVGNIDSGLARRTGLPSTVQVYCGIHDSNAALLAARAFPEIANQDATVLSTGTWFVAMRSLRVGESFDLAQLQDDRDCLINVDSSGNLVPSSRFMGGREIQILTGIDTRQVDIVPDQPLLVAAVPDVLRSGAMVLPTFAPGCGPFSRQRGEWLARPDDAIAPRAAVSLYAALVSDVCLDLIGSCNNLLIEGRFAKSQVFIRGLAALRRDMNVYVANIDNDVAFGALRLIDPSLSAMGRLSAVEPLPEDLPAYRQHWHQLAVRTVSAA